MSRWLIEASIDRFTAGQPVQAPWFKVGGEEGAGYSVKLSSGVK